MNILSTIKKLFTRNKGATQTAPRTGGYTTFNQIYWQQPRDLPPFTFYTIYNMLIDPEVRLALAIRSAPIFGVEWAWKNDTGQWQPGIQAKRPEVGLFVQRQLERIWHNHVQDLVKAQIWGWAAGEITLRLGYSKLVEINQLIPRKAADCRLVLSQGKPWGVRVMRIKDVGEIDLEFPTAFFHAHDAEPGNHYGNSVLVGAYNPWADKWLEGGALDVRRLFMHKDAYGSADLGYPDGETYVDGQNAPVPNRDIARQIVEQIRSGNVIVRPSERDANGHEKWPLTRATIPANPAHILQYPKDLDGEIRHGIGLPDQITDNSGAWAGARIPMAAFYASLDTWVIQMVSDLDDQVIRHLVCLNFGPNQEYQITHKPLAQQAMEQQSNAGPGGAFGGQQQQPQPGNDADLFGGLGQDNGDPGQPPIPQQPPRQQPLQMSLDAVTAVGEGVLNAAELVRAAKSVLAQRLSVDPDWREEQHPRGADGKFIAKGAGTEHAMHEKRLRIAHHSKTVSGYSIKAIMQRGKKGKGYYLRLTRPDRSSVLFDDKYDSIQHAADAGAERLLQHHYDHLDAGGEPVKPRSTTKPPAPKPAKTGQNWRYKSRDFFSKGLKAKFRDNVEAIKTMRTLKLEQRDATPEEKESLSKYVGWGQFPALFSYSWHDNQQWRKERQELQELISDEEFKAARASTINAHYTHPDVVAAHWDMARKLGFTGGRYLEPAVGSGYYVGYMPEDVAKRTHVTAVEMDQLTGNIAKQLYPDATVHVKPFQHLPTPDNFYDLVATNVPFSSEVRITDPKYKSMKPTLHDYYFLRSVDTAKPGGLIMHLTSAGTMDKLDDRVRNYINKHCELVSAIRFPGDAHKENAGTDVVTDMLILRKKHPDIPPTTDETPDDAQPEKQGFTGITRDSLGRLYHWRDGKRVPAPDWSKTTTVPDPAGGEPITINQYFADNPEQILGTLDRSGTMYSGGMKNVTRTADYDARLASAIGRLPDDIVWTDKDAKSPQEPERISSPRVYNEGQIVFHDGKLYQFDSGALVALKANKGDEERITGQLAIRDAARRVIAQQQAGEDDTEARQILNEAYDRFTEKHGPLHNRKNINAMREDPDASFLLSLEHYNSGSKESKKADVFSKNTVRRDIKAVSAAGVHEATGIVLHETGRVDLLRIAELTGKDHSDVERELVRSGLAYHDPSKNGWVHAAEYLSGNTRRKLLEAKAAAAADPSYEANVRALEKSQPEDIDHEEIGLKLGAPWVPPNVISQFAAEMLGADKDDIFVKFTPATSEWHVDTTKQITWRRSNTEVWGVRDDADNIAVDFVDCLKSALSGKPIVVRSASKGADEKTYPVLPEQTEAAREKVEELRSRFKEWVWEDEDRRRDLHRFYNDNYNNIVPMKFDGSHLTFPGMTEKFKMRDIQKNFVWRVITSGKGLAAHEVGTGKTASMVAAAMELRRLGLAKKPAIAVLKSNIEQITAEALELYPGAKILSTADMFDTKKRRQTLNRIATGDYDMIIMTHDHLNAMKMKPENIAQFMQEEIDELSDSILAAEAEAVSKGEKKQSNRIVKQLESQKQKLEEKLRAALAEERKDDIYFEDSGIDQIFVDEAHKFKSLPCYTRRGQIKGIPSGRSQRATNMLARTRWMLDNNNGRGVVFATGTPIANTMGEMFNMQRYLQFDQLKERGVHRFDAWADTYGDVTNRIEFKLNGDVAPTNRFNEFVNLPELRHLASDFMDVQRADELMNPDGTPVIKRPKRHDRVVRSQSNEYVAAMMEDIHKRAEALKGARRGEKGEDNMLSVCNDAKLGSIDLRLLSADAPDHPDSKVNQCVRKVLELYHEHPGTTQCVFSDLGIHDKAPKKKDKAASEGDDDELLTAEFAEDSDGNAKDKVFGRVTKFSVFKDMKEKLIAAGIPADHIVDFSDASMKGAKRDEAQQAMKRGEVRIAFGSTARLGTGTNVQHRLRAIHHLDIPYVPAFLEQRDGRGYRSGNQNQDLDIYKYVQEDSADNLFWQIVANKTHFINQYMRGRSNRSMQDLDTESLTPDEMIAVATGDTDMLERVNLEDEVRKLRRSELRHKSDQDQLQAAIEAAPERLDELKAIKVRHSQDAQHVARNEDFSLGIDFEGHESSHSERGPAEQALDDAIKSAKSEFETEYSWDRPDEVTIGHYKSMPIYLKPNGMLELEGPSGHRYESGGSLKSLEYAARAIQKKHDDATKNVSNFEADVAKMRESLGQPFRHSEALKEKERRLQELKDKRKSK